jgi:hypothetical protein
MAWCFVKHRDKFIFIFTFTCVNIIDLLIDLKVITIYLPRQYVNVLLQKCTVYTKVLHQPCKSGSIERDVLAWLQIVD